MYSYTVSLIWCNLDKTKKPLVMLRTFSVIKRLHNTNIETSSLNAK